MRWFIVYVCVQKRKGFPNPNHSLQSMHAGTNPDSIRMYKKLSQNVVDLAAVFVFETNV